MEDYSKAALKSIDNNIDLLVYSRSDGNPYRMPSNQILPVFNIDNYGAVVNDITYDSTSAIQAAINAAIIAKGGIVYIPEGKYYLNGALDAAHNNCQLYIPEIGMSSNDRCTIIITGALPASCIPCGGNLGNLIANSLINTGSQLISTITGSATLPSVISGIAGTGGFGFNYCDIYIKNLAILLPANISSTGPTLTGINGKYFHQLGVEDCFVSIDKSLDVSVNPTNECAGVIIGAINSDPVSYVKNTIVLGFKYGFVCGELVKLDYAAAWQCYYGFTFMAGYYPNVIRDILPLWCPVAIYIPSSNTMGLTAGVTRLSLDGVYNEYYVTGTKWANSVYYVYDPGNNAIGTMSYSLVQSGVGVNYALFNKSGGINLLCKRKDSSIPEWTTAGRPTVSTVGVKLFGYNTDANKIEYYNGSTWVQL